MPARRRGRNNIRSTMEITDFKLEQVFNNQATKAGSALSCRLSSTEAIRVCRSCVLVGDPLTMGVQDKEGLQEYSGLPLLQLSSVGNMVPALMLDPASIWLSDRTFCPDIVYIPVGRPPFGGAAVWAVRRVSESEYDLVEAMPIPDMSLFLALRPAVFALSDGLWNIMSTADVKTLRPRLQRMRMNDVLCVHFQGATCTATVTLTPLQSDKDIVINANGKKYVLDGYDEKTSSWKSIKEKKEPKMKSGLPRPAMGNSANNAQVVTPATATEEIKQAVSAQVAPAEQEVISQPMAFPQPAPAPVPEEVAPVEAEAPAQATVAQIPVMPEAPAQDEAPAEKQKKPRATKPQTKPNASNVTAITKLTSDLSADVGELTADKFQDALEEERALRDLGIVLNRRMANLFIALFNSSKGAVEKLAQLQQLFK